MGRSGTRASVRGVADRAQILLSSALNLTKPLWISVLFNERPLKNALFCPIFRRRRRLWRDKLRQAQILILETLKVFLWLEFSPSLTLNKIEYYSKVSMSVEYRHLSLSDLNSSRMTMSDMAEKENLKGVWSKINLRRNGSILDSRKNLLGKSPPSLRGPQ
jgi:hypothetical protein